MNFAASLLDVLFPPRCAACRELMHAREAPVPALPFCVECAETLVTIDECCRVCGVPAERSPCASCLASEPAFDRARGVYLYGAAIAEVLHRFKYEDHPELARPLARELAGLASSTPDVVAPMPLHASRRRSRTYDQALYLARELAKAKGWSFDASLLVRERSTGRQVGRQRDDRARNVAGAFQVRRAVANRSVLLVDDVVTTGATASECARVLKQAGARRVEVVAVARAA